MTFDKHYRIRALREIFTRPGGAGSLRNLEEVATLLEISSITVYRWVQDYINHGTIEPSRKRSRTTFDNRVQSLHLDFAQQLLFILPTLYYREVCDEIQLRFNVTYNKQQMCDGLHGRGITRKVCYLLFI